MAVVVQHRQPPPHLVVAPRPRRGKGPGSPAAGFAHLGGVGSTGRALLTALQARGGNAAMQRIFVQRACACGSGCACEGERSDDAAVQRAADDEETTTVATETVSSDDEGDLAALGSDTSSVDDAGDAAAVGGQLTTGSDAVAGADDVVGGGVGGILNNAADAAEDEGDLLGGALAGGGGAPPAPRAACAATAGCPSSFCAPLPGSKAQARDARNLRRGILLGGIGAFVDSRVLPLWSDYLGSGTSDGGGPVRDLSTTFAFDFATSKTTAKTTDFLTRSLARKMRTKPPATPIAGTVGTEDIATRLPGEINEIDTPTAPNSMDFDQPGEVPGNIAGGIGKDQAGCAVGASPSTQDDDRLVTGTSFVTRNGDGSLRVLVLYNYTVHDTLDLCPGNCGAIAEMIATLPMSRFEASGVSGDIPFVVNFTDSQAFTVGAP